MRDHADAYIEKHHMVTRNKQRQSSRLLPKRRSKANGNWFSVLVFFLSLLAVVAVFYFFDGFDYFSSEKSSRRNGGDNAGIPEEYEIKNSDNSERKFQDSLKKKIDDTVLPPSSAIKKPDYPKNDRDYLEKLIKSK